MKVPESFKVEGSRQGDLFWLALPPAIVAFDVFSRETASSAFHRYMNHPLGKYAAVGAVGLISAHLMDVPERYGLPDPIKATSDFITRQLVKIQEPSQ